VVVTNKDVCQDSGDWHFRVWEESSLLNTRVDNLQLGHFEQCSTKCKAAAGSSPPVAAVTFSCSFFVTVCAAAVCVGTIEAVFITAQLVIQTVCQSTRGNTVSRLAP